MLRHHQFDASHTQLAERPVRMAELRLQLLRLDQLSRFPQLEHFNVNFGHHVCQGRDDAVGPCHKAWEEEVRFASECGKRPQGRRVGYPLQLTQVAASQLRPDNLAWVSLR